MPMKPLLSLSPSRSSLHNSLQAGAGRKPWLLLMPKGGGARGSIVKTSFHGESCCCGLKKGPRRGSSLPNLFFISFGQAEAACRDRRDDFVIHPQNHAGRLVVKESAGAGRSVLQHPHALLPRHVLAISAKTRALTTISNTIQGCKARRHVNST